MIKHMLCAAWFSVLMALVGCGPLTFTVGNSPAGRKITTSVVQEADGWTRDRVAIIDVTGMITNRSRSGLLSEIENPVGLLHEKLEDARRDAHIKAVIIRLNTPGGTVTASDAMYREVMRFKQKSQKPVVGLMMDVAASGGYYLACATDEIVAYPTTITGSIGVIVQTFSVKPMLNRWGVKTDAIVSGPNKDAGSPLSEMSPEQRAIFQGLVDQFYANFVEVVKTNRPGIEAASIKTVTDGRVFTGTEAKTLGLVDQTGDLYDAFETAKQRAGIDDAQLVLYHREGDFAGSAYAQAPAVGGSAGTQINLAQINMDVQAMSSTDVFLYLWQPGP
ncbi:signal peptide peptidase SppA [Planctomycetales bacterium ZRK34]|nr:signal peptide peptidase SppA [Planctomycetales bacterium ZRK34]